MVSDEIRVLVLGANGQDGFLTTLLSLEKGHSVTACTRAVDPRLAQLATTFPNLKVISEVDYLEEPSLTRIVKNVNPTHVMHLASSHGPAGTMLDSPTARKMANFLNVVVPQSLIELGLNKGFHLTFPSSSRVFSGYLSSPRASRPVSTSTPLNPSDYYGEAKARLLDIAETGRRAGLRIHSPILFNHDSLFKRAGYISWVIASNVAAQIQNLSPPGFKRPDDWLNLSSAVDVCMFLIERGIAESGTTLIGSEKQVRIIELARDCMEELVGKNDQDREVFNSQNEAAPTLEIDAAHEKSFLLPYKNTVLTICVMTVSLLPELPIGFDKKVRILKALPETYRGNGSSRLHQLLPIDTSSQIGPFSIG